MQGTPRPDTPLKNDTLFRIASMSKRYQRSGMVLYEEGLAVAHRMRVVAINIHAFKKSRSPPKARAGVVTLEDGQNGRDDQRFTV